MGMIYNLKFHQIFANGRYWVLQNDQIRNVTNGKDQWVVINVLRFFSALNKIILTPHTYIRIRTTFVYMYICCFIEKSDKVYVGVECRNGFYINANETRKGSHLPTLTFYTHSYIRYKFCTVAPFSKIYKQLNSEKVNIWHGF